MYPRVSFVSGAAAPSPPRGVLGQAGLNRQLLQEAGISARCLLPLLTWPVTSPKKVHTVWATTEIKGRATKERSVKCVHWPGEPVIAWNQHRVGAPSFFHNGFLRANGEPPSMQTTNYQPDTCSFQQMEHMDPPKGNKQKRNRTQNTGTHHTPVVAAT